MDIIYKTLLPGKRKLWCLEFGLLPRLRWPLTVYEVAISEVGKFERAVALSGKGLLELRMTSLVEEFKCAKTSLEMTLLQSKGPLVKNTTSMVKNREESTRSGSLCTRCITL